MPADNSPARPADLNHLLDQVQVVLVETTLSANIGSSARALKTMGLTNLSVVSPKQPIGKQACAMAAGAVDLLESVTHYPTLQRATQNAQLIVALSGRTRTLGQPTFELSQAARQITQVLTGDNPPKVSLVFGREDRGLTNEELAHCHWLVHIEASADYGVLNLSQAVQVSCYALRHALRLALDQKNPRGVSGSGASAVDILPTALLGDAAPNNQLLTPLRTAWDEPAARADQHEQLATLSLELLEKLQLYDPKHPRRTEFRLKRLAKRLQLDRIEYNLIRSALARLLR